MKLKLAIIIGFMQIGLNIVYAQQAKLKTSAKKLIGASEILGINMENDGTTEQKIIATLTDYNLRFKIAVWS
jgi:hypothetical protein